MDKLFRLLPNRYVWLAALPLVALVASIDFVTGALVTVSAFYTVPVILIAWVRPRVESQLIIFLIITVWAGAHWLTFDAYLTHKIVLWNSFVRWLHLSLIAELVMYISQLLLKNRALANEDFLTGMPNRRSFDAKLQRCLSSPVQSEFLAFTIIDLDFFKQKNDVHGHSFGDQLLIKVAQKIMEECTASDFCGRLGGDEFALVLFSDDFEELKVRIQILTSALNEEDTSCSIGCCITRQPKLSSSLYELADNALYQTKDNGRGAVTIVGDFGPLKVA